MMRPKHLSLVVMAYSPVNREIYGIKKHMEADGFQVMLLGYAVDDGEIHVVDFTNKERLPSEIVRWIKSSMVIKQAFDMEYVKRIVERLFRYEVPVGDSSWKSTGNLMTQYGLPADEMLLYEKLGLDKPKCSYIDACLQLFCEPEHISVNERRIYPREFPALWRNVVHHCEWLVYMEISVREHLKKYPVNEMQLLQEELECRYQAKMPEDSVLLDITYSSWKFKDEKRLCRAIKFVIDFNECIDVDNFKIQYRNKCLWIMSPNGSFIMYINPCFEDEKNDVLRYERYCTSPKTWEIQLVSMRGIVDDLYGLMEHDYRVLIAMQCWYRNICAKVVGNKICVALKSEDTAIINEIIERTRMDG